MSCTFCEIIAGRVPSYIVHQDRWTMSFLDINPVGRGHCLVVPRRHVVTFHDLPAHLVSRIMSSVSFVSSALMASLPANGFNLFLNNGDSAGQIIPHLHFHILPRWRGDETSFTAVHKKISAGEMQTTQEKITAHIRSLQR